MESLDPYPAHRVAELSLSDDTRKRLEEITLVAFQTLMLHCVSALGEKIEHSTRTLTALESIAASKLGEAMICGELTDAAKEK